MVTINNNDYDSKKEKEMESFFECEHCGWNDNEDELRVCTTCEQCTPLCESCGHEVVVNGNEELLCDYCFEEYEKDSEDFADRLKAGILL
jgi:hypothetical protein